MGARVFFDWPCRKLKICFPNHKMAVSFNDIPQIIKSYSADLITYQHEPMIYLIRVGINRYKFGRTDSCKRKVQSVIRTFTDGDFRPRLIGLWRCLSIHGMKQVESGIIRYCRKRHLLGDFRGSARVINTDSVDMIIRRIDHRVEKINTRDEQVTEVRRLELLNELLKRKNEETRLTFKQQARGL